jgi:hypothetical protein
VASENNTGGGQLPPVTLDTNRYHLERPESGGVVLHINETANVAEAVATAEARRHKEQYLGQRRGADFVPVARIPLTTMRALAVKYGIDPINCLGRNDWQAPTQAELRRLERIIELETPKLKTTEKRFNLKPNSVRSVS